MTRTLRIAVATLAGCASLASAHAGDQTVGLFINEPGAFTGYTLFSPLGYEETYLIDINGLLVNRWVSEHVPGNSYYLRENGNLVRPADPGGNPVFVAGGDAGLVEEYDWDGNLVWSFLYSNADYRAHHDVALLPNGNVLILAWEYRNGAECIAAGRDPALLSAGELWPEHVVEVEPVGATGGKVVWAWHVWDHLIQDFDPTKDNFGVIGDHAELVDLNYVTANNADWLHANAIDYNAELDQIMVSSPRFHEFWVIDHGTTTEEAAGHTGGTRGHGGDLLYRWGNPQAYDRGDTGDQRFFGQHDPHWIPAGRPGAGNMVVFNNGPNRPEGNYSTIDELTPPLDKDGNYVLAPDAAYGPDELTWSYTADPPESFYSGFISGAQRQPNGNTLICSGAWGEFFEVDEDDAIVWLYVNPVTNTGPLAQGDPIPPIGNSTANRTFRTVRYAPDFPGFDGRDLTPGGPLEIYPCPADLDDDHVVGFSDVLEILTAWGPCPGCPEDLDGSGEADFGDILIVLATWGPCGPR